MNRKLSVLALGVTMLLMVSACSAEAAQSEKPVPPAQTVQNVQDVQNEEVVKAEATEDLAPVVEQEPVVEVEPVVNVEPVSEADPEADPQEIYTFTDCNETVYATSQVNLRSGPSTDYEKVGSLSTGNSVTRTGIGTGDFENWSRVILADGTEVYVNNGYISTTKPVVQQQQTKPSGGGSTTTSNPSGTTQSTTPSSEQSSSSDGTIYTWTPEGGGLMDVSGGHSVANEGDVQYSGTIG